MWSFRRPGGSGMEQASSDAMAVRFALPVLHSTLSFLGRLKPFFSFWQRKKRMGSKTIHILLWIVETGAVEKRLTDVSRRRLWTTL